jgi:hypothetical protein
MQIFAIVIFGISLIGIGMLFLLKRWETEAGRVLAPAWRKEADYRALALKDKLFHLRRDLARIPPIALLYCRYLVHEGALGFAAFARMSEGYAHRLADLVSHKHTFVPRETKSEFLRQVSEHKNGAGEH